MLRKTTILTAVAAVSFYACGYRFTDTGQFPADVSSIFIKLFENRTSEVGIESVFTDELTSQFTSRGNARALTNSAMRSDAVLLGVVKRVDITNISKTSETVVSQRRVVVTVAASLTASDGKTVWQVSDVTGTGTYDVDPDDYEVTEGNKRSAIAVSAVRIAEMLYNSLIEGF